MVNLKEIVEYLIDNRVQFSVEDYKVPDKFNIVIIVEYMITYTISPSIGDKVKVHYEDCNSKGDTVELFYVEFKDKFKRLINSGFELSLKEVSEKEISHEGLRDLFYRLSYVPETVFSIDGNNSVAITIEGNHITTLKIV